MNRSRYMRARRLGVSEILGTVLTIAITLIAGFAVYGYINGQSSVSESQYAQAIGESFVVVDMSFNSTTASLTLYNNGQTNLDFTWIGISSSSGQLSPSCYMANASGGCAAFSVSSQTNNPGSIVLVALPGTFSSGSTYYVHIVGQRGYSVTYFACDNRNGAC